MVTAVGSDRPGVVAALAGVLVEQGCNLSDAQMAVLQGQASMMLVVDCPDHTGAEALQTALVGGTAELGHAVWVSPIPAPPERPRPGRRWQVAVHGSDRPGVVYEVSRLLAEAGVNVVDMKSRQLGAVSSMTMEVDVPVGVDGAEVADRLDRLGEHLGLACSMRPGVEDH